MTDEMKGKVCVVTGATTGIGRETARGLAAAGATVVLLGRDGARAEDARADLTATTGNENLHVALADLASLAEVRRVGAELRARFPVVHVLVNNAGAIFGSREETVDGFERTFAVNHLAYFLLTHELLRSLRAGGPARIVNVSSAAHKIGKLHWDDLQLTQGYAQFKAYSQSKLANILFTRELARRLQGSGITANSLHPGTIASNFGKSGSRFFAWLVRLARVFLIGPVRGARTSLYLATAPELAGVTGEYFQRCKRAKTTKSAKNDEDAARLWKLSEAMCQVAR